MILTAGKESFVARVLINKAEEMGVKCSFVPCNTAGLSEEIGDVTLISLYLDDDTKVNDEIIHLLTDKMRENGGQLILIGENSHIDLVVNDIPELLIYKMFPRPVNNDAYAYAVKEYFNQERKEDEKKRILIVDDDPQYLNLVREWLKDRYKIFMANSGLQAIKLLGRNTVDLILLDYEMPITTGPQVLEMLRADEDTKSIPVMFLTSKSDKKSVMEVVELRPEAYFLKSITKPELLEKLMDYFGGK